MSFIELNWLNHSVGLGKIKRKQNILNLNIKMSLELIKNRRKR
jgi:hypothetical protein